MWGRALFTTVMSSTKMNWIRAMTAKAVHRRRSDRGVTVSVVIPEP